MATDWVEYLSFLKAERQVSALAPTSSTDFWTRFKTDAQSSQWGETLADLLAQSESLSRRLRLSVAVAISRILSTLEWPPAWDARREALAGALDGLAEVVREWLPSARNDFDSAAPSEQDIATLAYAGLVTAQALLRHPCRRDELRTVAVLCNAVAAAILRAQQRRCSAEVKFTLALARYTKATGAMNDAVGTQLFF